MRAPPSSPARAPPPPQPPQQQAQGDEGPAVSEEVVGTTGPTPEEQARKEGEAAALLDLYAPDEAGIVAASVWAGEALTVGACAWTLGAVVLAAYWRTLPPGLAAADDASGELVAAACELGKASPSRPLASTDPQHPALTLLLAALAMRLLPASSGGSPAWRANLLSALGTTLATALLFLCVHLVGRAQTRRRGFLRHGMVVAEGAEAATSSSIRSMAAAAAAALLFAWSPRTWEYATKADGAALDTALLAAGMWAALQFASTWNGRARRAWARAGVCVAGLAFCNQPSMTAAPIALLGHGPLLAFMVAGLVREAVWQLVLLDLGAVFGLSLLPSMYLPLASFILGSSGTPPPLGTSYAVGAETTDSWSTTAHRLVAFAGEMALGQGLYGVGPLLELAGVVVCIRGGVGRFLLPARYTGEAAKVVAARNRHIQTALGQLPDAHGQQQQVLEEVDQREREARQASARVVWAILGASILCFLAAAGVGAQQRAGDAVVTHLLGCFWAGVGLDWALQQLLLLSMTMPAAHGATRRALRYLGAAALCIGAPLLQLLRAQHQQQQVHMGAVGASACPGGLDLWRCYSTSLLEPLPHKAALLVPPGGIQASVLRYHQACEAQRPDVKVLPLPAGHGGSMRVWPAGMTTRSLRDTLIDTAPGGVFLAGYGTETDDYGEAYATVPFGLTMRFVRRDAPEAERRWHEANHRAWRVVLHRALPPLTVLPARGGGGAGLVARDVFEHLAESASHLLDEVIEALDQDQEEEEDGEEGPVTRLSERAAFGHLAETAWWLEVVAAHDPGHASSRVLRNLGLAYSHMLRLGHAPASAAQTLLKFGGGGEPEEGLFRDVARNVPWLVGTDDWRAWAGERLLDCWRVYLEERPEAAHEPGRDKIQHLYEELKAAAAAAKTAAAE